MNHPRTELEMDRAETWGSMLDIATQEVFQMMLGCEVRASGMRDEQHADVTAVVGLAGSLCGALSVRCNAAAAVRMTALMLGIGPESVNQEYWDAVGEVCNMIAGNFKTKLRGIDGTCMLSVPTVVSGADYSVRSLASGDTIYRAFTFEGEPISVCLEIHA